MTTARRAPSRPEAALAVIRMAMLAGVLAFGGVIWVLHRQPTFAAMPSAKLRVLTRAMPAVPIVALLALVGLRVAAARADAARGRSLNVIGWAVGEFAALAGGVHYFLSNDPQWYVLGVLVLLAAYVVLPIRRSR